MVSISITKQFSLNYLLIYDQELNGTFTFALFLTIRLFNPYICFVYKKAIPENTSFQKVEAFFEISPEIWIQWLCQCSKNEPYVLEYTS